MIAALVLCLAFWIFLGAVISSERDSRQRRRDRDTARMLRDCRAILRHFADSD